MMLFSIMRGSWSLRHPGKGRIYMTVIEFDVKNPTIKILVDRDMRVLEKKVMDLSKEGWYPVGGGFGRKGHDWIQTMIKEGET